MGGGFCSGFVGSCGLEAFISGKIGIAFRTAVASTCCIFQESIFALITGPVIVKRVVPRTALTGCLIVTAPFLALPATAIEIIRETVLAAMAATCVIRGISLGALVAPAIIIIRGITWTARAGFLIVTTPFLALPALTIKIIRETVLAAMAATCVVFCIALRALVTPAIVVIRVISRTANAGCFIVYTSLLALPASPIKIIRVSCLTAMTCTRSEFVITLGTLVTLAVIIKRVTIRTALSTA